MSKNNIAAFIRSQGAGYLSAEERHPEDYYATDPIAVECLLDAETFQAKVWEPASGGDHLANVLRSRGFLVRTSDIVKRTATTEELDFLEPFALWDWDGDIITNPPFRFALQFIERALATVRVGAKVAFLLKLNFLEGGERKEFFRSFPPKVVYVFSHRISCYKNGVITVKSRGCITYAWFVWVKGYRGDPVIKWCN